MPKHKYVVQTNRSGGACFRVPLESACSVRDALAVVSARMSAVLSREVRATHMLVVSGGSVSGGGGGGGGVSECSSRANLFKEDLLEDAVEPGELLYVELEDVDVDVSHCSEEKECTRELGYIDMSECESAKMEIKEDRKCDGRRLTNTVVDLTDNDLISESKVQSKVQSMRDRDDKESSTCSWWSSADADQIFLKSFSSALQDLLPSPAYDSLQEIVSLASRISRVNSGVIVHKEEKRSEGVEATPSMRQVSYLSTWATDVLFLMKEARACFDFHHLSHGDEDLKEPTPVTIYDEV